MLKIIINCKKCMMTFIDEIEPNQEAQSLKRALLMGWDLIKEECCDCNEDIDIFR